ncbi:MAG: ABC transporter ATP-binding protein [Roseivirga sp.]|nr:ABC transporter ATP-binding protein [Roseivirga sp.]
MAKSKPTRISTKKVFKEIILPRKWMLLLGLVLILLQSLASLVLPWAIKVIADYIIINDPSATKSPSPSEPLQVLGYHVPQTGMDLLKIVVIVSVGAIIVRSSTSFALTRLLSVQAQALIAKLRVQVQKKILSLPINFFDNQKSGALVSRIMTDVEGVRNIVGTGLVQMIGGFITAIGVVVILVKINYQLTLFVFLPIILFGIVAMKAFKYIRPIFRKRGELNAQVTGRLTETLGGIRVIKGFGAEESEINTFSEGVNDLYLNVKRSLTATALVSSSAIFLLAGVASTGIMGLGGYYGMQGEMTSGDFFAFISYLALLVAPILQMSNIGSQLTEAFAGLDRTEEIMNMEAEEDDATRTETLGTIKGDIEFNKVTFAYEEDKDVLKGIDFSAPSGSVTALVGTSGSGKSTIAGLAASFLQPNGGAVTIDGTDLATIKLKSYRSHLGVVLQDDFLFEGTIRDNILFPRPNATEEELQAAVSAAHVNEFTDRFEEGLETVIGERGVKLSGGQRQRLAIARAILADPQILILDEATSNLDTESETYIQQSLTQLMKGRTTFVIAHRLSTIRQADQILVIEDGEIFERGTHDELIAKEGRYHQLYTYQARI